MHRRAVLASLGVGLLSVTGCLGEERRGDGSVESDATPTEIPARDTDDTTAQTEQETTMEAGIPRTVSLAEQSDRDLREAFGIGASVTVLEPRVTDTHTARIEVALDNVTARSQTLSYTRERCDLNLIEGSHVDEGGVALLLISTEQAWNRVEPDCWVPDGRNIDCGIPAVTHRIEVAPDEPFRWTFRLWADPENSRSGVCMPLGAYRFARVLTQEGVERSLSFALSVESG
jgi:hypothetical protein